MKQALIDAAFTLLAEEGLAGFSVARLAQRVGVSPGAPYRHFADRDELLATVSVQMTALLVDTLQGAALAAGSAPEDRLAATAGGYVRFVLEHGVGLDLVFTAYPGPQGAAARQQSRRLMDLLLPLARAATPDPHPLEALALLESHLALAEGFATLRRSGPPQTTRLSVDEIAERATRASAALIRGNGGVGPSRPRPRAPVPEPSSTHRRSEPGPGLAKGTD